MAYTFKHGDRPLEGVTIQRAVGRGGFGEVYYALTDSGKQIALKYLRENPEVELRGIAQVMNLKSPHLISIFDVRKNESGDPFVLMEYVSGPSLRELLLAEPAGLGAQKAAFFTVGIAKGLSYLHERGIVHRDLKPGNIFYDDGYVKIGDYGLSKHISMSQHSGQTVSVGTVHYMAPEIGSGSYSKAIDIYALGVILYEMLTGRLPFTGSSMGEVLMRHLSDRPDMSGVPEPFATVIARALQKDPKDRYQDVNEMVDQLNAGDGVSASVASFDPATLTHVPRDPRAMDDRTVTTPPRGAAPPPLDVHGIPLPPLPERLTEREARRAEKLERRLEKMAARTGRARPPREESLPAAAMAPGERRRRGRQVVTMVIVAGVISVAMALLRFGGNDDRVAAATVVLLTWIGGGVVGTLLSHFKLLSHNPIRNEWIDRIVMAGVSMLMMAPGYALAADELRGEHFAPAMFGPIAAIALCDFRRRIDAGRRLRVDGSQAFTPAIVALAAAAIAKAGGNNIFIAAAVAATISLLVQTASAMWPLVATSSPAAQAPPQPPAGGWQRATAAMNEARREFQDKMQKMAADVRQSVAGAPTPPGTLPPAGSAKQARTSDPSAAAFVLDMGQPSFVGRTANAGLGFLGKLLLGVALLVALGYNAIPDEGVRLAVDGKDILAAPNGRVIVNGIGRHGTQELELPKSALVGAMLLGGALLVLARRNDGGMHFARGVLGCAGAIVAAVFAMGPAAHGIRTLISSNDWSDLSSNGLEQLVMLAAALLASVLLIFWPRRRTPRSIVI
ncbi:MAG: serine/threonine-protein kinase [Phycisphaerae bacterium]